MNIKKTLAAAGLAAFLTVGCATSQRHNLTSTPGNVQYGLEFPDGVSGQVYVEKYRGDLQTLTLRIEGFRSAFNPNYKVSKNATCPLFKPFSLKLGERCYLENEKGLVELFWQIETKKDSIRREVILYMNLENNPDHSRILGHL